MLLCGIFEVNYFATIILINKIPFTCMICSYLKYMLVVLIWECGLWFTENDRLLFQALHYLIVISEVEETEIFKICLEYWNSLAADLYSHRETPFTSAISSLLIHKQTPTETPSRRQFYNPVLSKVNHCMCALSGNNCKSPIVRPFVILSMRPPSNPPCLWLNGALSTSSVT